MYNNCYLTYLSVIFSLLNLKGFLVNFWATPVMTSQRLVFALFMTSYVLFATVHLEEPSIREELGSVYVEFLQRTPRFIPTIPSYNSYKLNIFVGKPGKKED